ncbi:Ketosteroid isomerase-related protein [Halapricum desulfuricans]|uniref:Ketosteroid isomerase-related protein n=1 Tax=Halapricum desulfuricans TaxID=2841257 RepID=A0A897NDK2_9EURY|nr:nuclear transport factor 2 family protein [Halapricum desulfuricans]QSG10461.1 Ketosteroid isomerase-related protein [Halapricum desulfuricans]
MDDRVVTARTYYQSLDDHDYETLRSVLTSTFVHRRPDMTLDGRDRFITFMRDERPRTDTAHPIDAIYESDAGLAVDGRLLAADGEQITAFVDVLRFDDGRIDRIRTYSG